MCNRLLLSNVVYTYCETITGNEIVHDIYSVNNDKFSSVDTSNNPEVKGFEKFGDDDIHEEVKRLRKELDDDICEEVRRHKKNF